MPADPVEPAVLFTNTNPELSRLTTAAWTELWKVGPLTNEVIVVVGFSRFWILITMYAAAVATANITASHKSSVAIHWKKPQIRRSLALSLGK
jgi:hypothetical protein